MDWFRRHSMIRNGIIAVAAVAVVAAFAYFISIGYGYNSYHFRGEKSSEMPEISFSYPAYFSRPVYSSYASCFLGETTRKEITRSDIAASGAWLSGGRGSLDIYFFDSANTGKLYDFLQADRDSFYNSQLIFNPSDETQKIIKSQTTVAEIPANEMFLSVGKPQDRSADKWGTGALVYFERDGCLWVIVLKIDNRALSQPPTYFDTLLKSFKFTGK